MTTQIRFKLNGNDFQMKVEDHWTLLHLLREELGLTGTKEGCGSGECGACTVIVDGQAINSCLFLAPEINGRELLTIEGLAAPDGTLHPLPNLARIYPQFTQNTYSHTILFTYQP